MKKKKRDELSLPINSIYTGALMVSTQQEEVLWIFDFVREQEADGLEWLLATIDIVAQEQVVWLGRKAAVLE